MSVKLRQELEQRIAEAVIDRAIESDYRIAVSLARGYDTDEMLLGSRDKEAIMKEVMAGDDCHVFVQPAEGPTIKDGQVVSFGWVYFVFGNDGYDVVSDYTTNLEPVMDRANALADKYSD